MQVFKQGIPLRKILSVLVIGAAVALSRYMLW